MAMAIRLRRRRATNVSTILHRMCYSYMRLGWLRIRVYITLKKNQELYCCWFRFET